MESLFCRHSQRLPLSFECFIRLELNDAYKVQGRFHTFYRKVHVIAELYWNVQRLWREKNSTSYSNVFMTTWMSSMGKWNFWRLKSTDCCHTPRSQQEKIHKFHFLHTHNGCFHAKFISHHLILVSIHARLLRPEIPFYKIRTSLRLPMFLRVHHGSD